MRDTTTHVTRVQEINRRLITCWQVSDKIGVHPAKTGISPLGGWGGGGGALSRGFCYAEVNSVLESLLSTFIRTQNASVELRRRHQMKFSREYKPH